MGNSIRLRGGEVPSANLAVRAARRVRPWHTAWVIYSEVDQRHSRRRVPDNACCMCEGEHTDYRTVRTRYAGTASVDRTQHVSTSKGESMLN